MVVPFHAHGQENERGWSPCPASNEARGDEGDPAWRASLVEQVRANNAAVSQPLASWTRRTDDLAQARCTPRPEPTRRKGGEGRQSPPLPTTLVPSPQPSNDTDRSGR